MPSFRNGLVLGLARGVRGFLNLEVGLTRGMVPSAGALEAQIREQQRKLNISREQLARRDQKIKEQTHQPEARETKPLSGPRRKA